MVFEGIKMGAEVRVNGVLLGVASNMFLRYQFSLKGLVSAGTNEVTVTFNRTTSGRFSAYSGECFEGVPS